ncbi:MAG: DUF3378 domain-containing protein [Candidatus Diapherotrites archaeon]|nr:DUF3378 domain-containing protein [Candidatus Diapherotrites archaeon]
MAITLNFAIHEKEQIKEIFSGFEKAKTNTSFEEARWKAHGCTVTLYSSGKLVIQGAEEEKVKEFVLSKMCQVQEISIGIDEVGRGEGFGPLVVAGVLGDRNRLRELRDSKKTGAIEDKKNIVSGNALAIATVEFSSEFVDMARRKGFTLDELQAKAAKGIAFALNPSNEWPVVVDGKPLKGCNGFEFLVKGDDLDPVVGAASVAAKSAREKSKDNGKRKTWKNSG